MKNIHLLPTSQQSRLTIRLKTDELMHSYKEFVNQKYEDTSLNQNQNIYITSDEEIKKGDWFYVKTPNIYGGNVITKSIGNSNGCWADHILTETTDEKGYHPSHCVKIILTTDQDLIKDGVQAIDDEFLEWFVKNPSCEFIEITEKSTEEIEKELNIFGHDIGLSEKEYSDWLNDGGKLYKIILPKEDWLLNNPQCKQIESCSKSLSKKCICPKKEAKQETLEEVKQEIHTCRYCGCKWQEERMYSEVFEWLSSKDYITDKVDIIRKEFEQFKKK